jgi:TonB family protein
MGQRVDCVHDARDPVTGIMRVHRLIWSASVVILPLTAAFSAGASDPARLAVGKADGGVDASTSHRRYRDAGPPVDWLHIPPGRYATALSGYLPAVGHRIPMTLGVTMVRPWAEYINSIHNRVHPLFADDFLERLDQLDRTDALGDKALAVLVEIAIDAQGRIARLGVVRSSGLATFDLGALEAVTRAAPFASPLPGMGSEDGMTYLHWTFHRDATSACSTMNTRPYRLGAPALLAPASACPPYFKYVVSDAGTESWEKVDCATDGGIR